MKPDQRKRPIDAARGDLLYYDYLWAWEDDQGYDARKPRETVVAARYALDGDERLLLLPVTSLPPQPGRAAFELPPSEVRRIVRGNVTRLWVMIDEANIERLADPAALGYAEHRGALSEDIFTELYRAFYDDRMKLRRVVRD